MDKYLQVFKISFHQEFAYKLNFIMWRVRNLMQIFLIIFLWDTVFTSPGRVVFGYDKAKILTYIFGLMIVRAFVLSARAIEVSGEVSRGDLVNYLIKPISYFKYWLTRDISNKFLNLGFAFFEFTLLYFLLRPPFFLQTNIIFLLSFFISLGLSFFTYFIFLFIVNSIPFWMPEAGFAGHFLLTTVVTEFLSGALFPLDILPASFQSFLNYTPFPYLIFFPLQVYLGKVTGPALVRGILISASWVVVLFLTMSAIWRKGLKIYQAYGR